MFVAVLIATLGALQYTKSAVLNSEKRRLSEAANELARNYMDKSKSASQARGLSFVDLNAVFSAEEASEISQGALQKVAGIGGGFYRSDSDLLLGYPPAPNSGRDRCQSQVQLAMQIQPAILDTARTAANYRVLPRKKF